MLRQIIGPVCQTGAVDLLIEENWRAIRRLGEKLGDFPGGLMYSEVAGVLNKRFHVTFTSKSARAWRGDAELRLDLLSYSHLRNEAYAVELRESLGTQAIQQMLKILQEFRSFFPEHRDKKLFGILAAVDAPPDLQQKVLREGIYLARIHDGVFEVQVPEDFQARAF
jgi:hypothetical protein